MKKYLALLSGTILVLTVLGVAPATASLQTNTYGFYNITNHSPDISAQLSLDVSNFDITNPLVESFTEVFFLFRNNVGTPSSITGVYFDDGALTWWGIAQSSGVSFQKPATPANLPGGATLTPAFVTTDSWSADSDNPPVNKGVNASTEWLQISFLLHDATTTITYQDVVARINAEALRVGVMVQGVQGGSSDSYVDTVIPEPATIAIWGLLSLTCGGFGLHFWRRNTRPGVYASARTPWSEESRMAIHQLIERGRSR